MADISRALKVARQALGRTSEARPITSQYGSFSGSKLPDAEKLARLKDKFIYHSATADQLENMRWGLEPQHGPWIKEMAQHTGDIEPEELLSRSVPLVWMSDTPSWVSAKVARKLNKHVSDVTEQEIREHGHLAIIPKKGEHAEHVWRVGDEGLSEGEYSTVTNLKGEPKKAYETDLYESNYGQMREPFGVERNEYVSAQPVEPMFNLTGQDLVDFLNATKRDGYAGGGIISRALKAARETLSPEELLMGIHNTRSGRGLEMVEKLGGLPAPSIAVTKPSQGYTSFGDISLVAPVEMVTPGRKTPAFGSDVYSPRIPNIEDDKIFRGFTPSGKRRYAPATMENVLREMKGPIRGGENFNYGPASIRAQVTPQFKSLAEMQAAREKIIPASEFEAHKNASNEMMERLQERFDPYFKSNDPYRRSWSAFPEALTDYARTRNPSEFAYDYKDLPAEALTEARSFLSHLRDMPTEYFEVKPQRGVPLSEFAGAVVPGDVPGEVVDRLRRLGIGRIEEYGDDASRRDALMKFVGEQGFAEGGEVREGYDKGGSIARRAVDAARRIMGYTDPPTKKIEDWKWRPLSEVDKELGLREIPPHVQQFGDYMRDMSDKAAGEGLSARDLIKGFTTTRASIQRQAVDADKLRALGLDLPSDVTRIRPEGAWAEWLMTPMGQRYLDAASKGTVEGDAVANAIKIMSPFGRHETDIPDAMRWAAENLPGREARASDLVARAAEGGSSPAEWRQFTSDIRGVGPSKSGFLASLYGRGDQPTLDARQIILNTGAPTKEAAKYISRGRGEGGVEAVERLAGRQSALGLDAPSKYDPFYQHLAHHAIWDKASNETTTHADVVNAMRNAGIVLGIPAAGAAVMPEDQPVERASGGRLLEDEYPTKYLPNVGRQVMADGGSPSAQSRRRATLEQLGSFEDRPPMDPAVMGQNWASAVQRFRERPLREGEATVRPLELGARDVIGGAIAGDGGITRGRIADIVAGSRGLPGSGTLGFGVADLTPVGVPLAVSDISDALRNEDYLSAGLGAALPAAYYARKPIMAAGRAVYDAGARAVDAARDVLGRVPAPVAAAGAGAAVMTPEEAEASKLNAVRRGLEAVRGIRAYHGSPHDFDRFDLSKIGTGEGAQAYGHGLYFAEAEPVAKGYRDKLTTDSLFTPTGDLFDPSSLRHMNMRVLARRNLEDLQPTIEQGKLWLSKIDQRNPELASMLRSDIDTLEQLAASGGVKKNPGRMYEVNIRANPEEFINFDAPFEAQPRRVQEVFGYLPPYSREGMDLARRIESRPFAEEAAAKGIPGIRYLDQGSRGAGEGSRNYVVFDDKLIDILRKYAKGGVAKELGSSPRETVKS